MASDYSVNNNHITISSPDGRDINLNRNSQIGITLEVLIDNKNEVLETGFITGAASKIYRKRVGKEYKELTGRHVRKLREEGLIETRGKGKYIFTGNFSLSVSDPFTRTIRDEIIKRDDYTCQNCGKTEQEGASLTADHILPQNRGGTSEIENGMCLCTKCENIKADYDVNHFGKKMFQKFLKTAQRNKDKENIEFFKIILGVFDKFEKN